MRIGALVLALSAAAQAGEIQIEGSLSARASTWRGDFGGGGHLRLGYRVARVLAFDVAGWEEFLAIDRRFNTGLTAGVSAFLPLGPLRPTARFYFIHQHEEAAVSVLANPIGVLFGIGDGIRHRAGGGASLGVEIPVAELGSMEFTLVGTGSATWFPDPKLGPAWYFGLYGGFGVNYALAELP